MEETRFADVLATAGCCLTGEGSVDRQTVTGKTVARVVVACRERGVPVGVVGGAVDPAAADALYELGASAVLAASRGPATLDEAFADRESERRRHGARALRHAQSVSTLGHYRMQALRSQLDGWGGRAAVIAPALIFGIGAAFATQSVGGAIFGLLLGAIGGFALLWQGACTRAIRMALEAWGGERGLAVVDPAPLPERMRWIDSTDGEMGPGLAGPFAGAEGGIGHYTYTTGSGKDRQEHPYTLAWTEIGVRDAASVSLGPARVRQRPVQRHRRRALVVARGRARVGRLREAVRALGVGRHRRPRRPPLLHAGHDLALPRRPARGPAGDRRRPAVPEPRGPPDRARRPRLRGDGARTVG